jgi:hypothetical protein
MTLEFDINKVKLVDKTYFNGNPVKKVQFLVVGPQDEQQREKKFELSKTHVFGRRLMNIASIF